MMSFENKGSVASTIVVSLSPDLTGNYVCSGAADEVEINLALAEANRRGGGRVLLLHGTYVLAAPITFPGNSLVLQGMGRATFIDGDALETGNHGIVITGRTDCIVKDLSIQTEDGGQKTCHCVFIEDGSNRFLVENVWVVDSDSNGIHIEGTTITGGTVRGCHVLDTDNYGIQVDMDAGSYAYDFLITENNVTGGGNSNIAFSASSGNTYCQIVDNNSYGCDGAEGIYVVAFHHGVISGNVCDSNTTEGIQVGATSTYTVVSDNVCSLNSGHGIFLEAADMCTVANNVCFDNDHGNTGNFDGIRVDADSSTNVIEGNVCEQNHGDGIYVDGPRNDIIGNKTHTNDQYGIQINAAEILVEGNDVYDNGQDAAGTYHGILLGALCFRCSIQGNHISDPGDSQEDGIYLTSLADQNHIVGNYCYNGMGSGICLINDNDNNHIVGNYLMHNDDYGIEITTALASYNHVKDNYFEANVSGQLLDGGHKTGVHEWNETMENTDAYIGRHPAEQTLDGVETIIRFGFTIPMDFQELVTAQLVIVAAAAGNLRWNAFTDWGEMCEAQDYNTHSDSVGATTTAVLINDLSCLDVSAALDVAVLTPGDRVGMEFFRDGDDALDTIGANVYVLLFRLRYV